MALTNSKVMIELINDHRGKINSWEYGEIVFVIHNGMVQKVKFLEALQVNQKKNQESKNV